MSTIGDIAGKPKSKIKIKPSHRGLLHKKLNLGDGLPIPKAKIAKAKARAKATGNTALMKETTFAQNFGHKK